MHANLRTLASDKLFGAQCGGDWITDTGIPDSVLPRSSPLAHISCLDKPELPSRQAWAATAADR